MIVLLFIALIALRLALLGFAAWITSINVNDIASYLAVGADAPFWPFFWILLVIGLFGLSFSFKTS